MPSLRRYALLALLSAALTAACAAPAAPPDTRSAASAPAAPAAGAPAASAGGAAATQPSAAPLTPVRSIYVAMGINSLPFWVAKEAGFFEGQGLDVDLTYVAGAVTPAQALTAGEALFASGGAATVTPARLAGADLVLIGTQVDRFQFSLLARPEIQRPEQLRGTRMGITRLGAATDWAGRVALRQWGLEPGRDVQFVQMGGNPEVLVGLESGATDSGLLTDPWLQQAAARGYRELLDLADTGVAFSPVGLVTTDTIVREKEATVRRYTRAWVEGIHYVATNKPGSLAVLSKYLRDDDTSALSEAYDRHVAKHLRRIPSPSAAVVQTVLDGLAESEPRARDAKATDFINDRFIRELEDAGVFRQLYGS